MALERRLFIVTMITISIGVSPIFTWNPDNHRYESYDLEKGPVFYEAYYPDHNEENRERNYQEKRYFDRAPVLEKSYQLSSESITYPEENVQTENYERKPETYLPRNEHFSDETNTEPLDLKEISTLARRAISRDLESWNTIENYLDRAKYREDSYRQRMIVPNSMYRTEQPILFQESVEQRRNLGGDLYEEIREEPVNLRSHRDQRDSSMVKRFPTNNPGNEEALGLFRSVRYENQLPREQEIVRNPRTNQEYEQSLRDENPVYAKPLRESYPTENIFEPRPQVINYIFSRKPDMNVERKVQNVVERQDVSESVPRKYGDNLIKDEEKKSEKDKDVKVTSIEVSEIPRHKTRHHHGEWPKRDYHRSD